MRKVIVEDSSAVKWDGKSLSSLPVGLYLAELKLTRTDGSKAINQGILQIEVSTGSSNYIHFVSFTGTSYRSFFAEELTVFGKLWEQDFEALKNGI